MKIQVITKIEEGGNLYHKYLYKTTNEHGIEVLRGFEDTIEEDQHDMILAELPVFTLGEIIIVDDNEREVGGIRRKASKWWVEYELFDNLDEAVAKANEIYQSVLGND
jgi:hypothetical protein